MKTENIARIIEENDDFLIITHTAPDGDAIGSAFGLLDALIENGKKAELYFHETIPEAYLPLIPDSLPPCLTGDFPPFSRYGMILCLDCSNRERFGDIDFKKYNSVNIDHHPDNTEFAKQNFVFPDAPATAKIVFDVLRNSQLRISRETATLLLTGLIMDTGGFRFQNTSPEALRTASDMMDLEADYAAVIDAMFFSKPAKIAKMEAEIVCYHLKTGCGGHFAWFYLSESLMDSFGVVEKDTEGLIDIIRAIKDFEIVAILKKKGNGFRISLRSKNQAYSVGRIARKLNGGGHELAAGGFIPAASIEEAEAVLQHEIMLLLDCNSSENGTIY